MLKQLLKGVGKSLIPTVITKLTKEKKGLKTARKLLDRNGDGFVNLNEIPGLNDLEDINGDGIVDKKDLIALIIQNHGKKIGNILLMVAAYFIATQIGLI